MATTNSQIPDRETNWDGFTGSQIQAFIISQFEQIEADTQEALAKKPAYFKRSDEKGSDNNYHIYGFASESDYLEWNSDQDTYADLLLSDVALPDTGSGSSAVSYIVNLYRDSSSDIVTTDNTVKINIRFTSQEYNPITQSTQDTTEGGTLTVQTRSSSTATWATKGTVAVSSLAADSSSWTEVDITNMLSTGTQQVRIIVKGDTTELSTRYLQFNVTKTTLKLTAATQWEKPFDTGTIFLSYYITGAIRKTLNISIDDGARTYAYSLGTTVYTESPRQVEVTDTSADKNKVITQGIHTIKAWLTVDDSDVVSDVVTTEVLVITDKTDKTVYLLLNDVNKTPTNWTSQTLFSYAIYNPNAETTPFTVLLSDYKGVEQYMQLDLGNVANNTKYELTNFVEIDSDDTTVDAYLHFYSGESEIRTMIDLQVDNQDNFSPTSGADFVLNPRLRTNDETNPATIINTADNSTVSSTWSGFKFKTDGWVTDEDGNRCLRVLAGRSLTIDYEPYQDFITDMRNSVTIELDFATRNVTDMDAAILRMCSYMNDSLPLGFEMNPTDGCFMTQNNRVHDDQDVAWQEGVRTHLAVNIIYGINNTSCNYVRLFINGTINREFMWTTTDKFVQYVNGKQTSMGIRIGNDTSDIDIYSLRVYRKSLSANDIRQDCMAAMSTVAEKLEYREANAILGDDNTISYTKAYDKYNTMVITGTVPSYSTGNVAYTNDVQIHIIDDPSHSGTLYQVKTTGQGTSSRSYWMWNFQFANTSATYWLDENGVNRGAAYQLMDGVPYSVKNVAKRNWASSMQSHKMGCVNLYTDLWKKCTGGSYITNTEGFEDCRVTVVQKPFLVFTRSAESDEPTFYGLYTFGPGKGDKPTFGYDKNVFPEYLMLEGCDNGTPLTNHRVPWNDDVTLSDEVIYYNGTKQWEVVMGNTESISYFQEAFNFFYLHSTHISPWVGTVTDLQKASSSEADRQTFYWVTKASSEANQFDLYRYDTLTSQWVDAGVAKKGEGQYEKLNIASQTGIYPSGSLWENINEQFVNARIADFKEQASDYINVEDGLYHSNFIKLKAASDNRAKNTYLYLTYKNDKLVIHWAQDDLDTIFATDNVGRKNKPYYVEEHDVDSSNATYWNGEQNALYDLIELAYPTELRSMMNTMFAQMADLAKDSSYDDKVFGCMDKYFFSTQRYFPAVAYNENARISYEAASAVWGNGYTGSTHPITQSLGDQLQCEMQWVKLRLKYLQSYASYGDFAMNGSNSLTFRSITTLAGAQPEYSFDLVPHIWLYPAISTGSSLAYGRDTNGKSYSTPQRVKAGEAFTLSGVNSDGNTNIQLCGIDNYRSIGEFGNKPIEGDGFTVAGERLTEFHASQQPIEFRPPKITVTAPLLKVFDINGASSVNGNIDFSDLTRLEEILIGGTSVTSIKVGQPSIITKLQLPSTLTNLSLVDYEALTSNNFSIEGVGSMQEFEFSNCPNLNCQSIIAEICDSDDFGLTKCVIKNVDWTNFSVNHLMKLAELPDITLTGKIACSTDKTQIITFENKRKLIEKFGNIDDVNNPVYITYTAYNLTSLSIASERYYDKVGTYQLSITPSTVNANTFTNISWSMTATNYATINSATGELTVNKVGTEEAHPDAEVTVVATLINGEKLTKTATICFYEHKCKVGDYVFADGTFSDVLNTAKTTVGICFYINPDDKSQRLAVALSDISTSSIWGLYFNSGWSEGSSNDATYNVRNIELADTPGYSVYNIPTIVDITSMGLYNSQGSGTSYITDDSYRDENYGDADGFKVPNVNTAVAEIGFTTLTSEVGDYKIGDVIPKGLRNTLNIIKHRNTILGDSSVNLQTPCATDKMTELESLNSLMAEIVTEKGSSKYQQYYYPAASFCYAYQPKVKSGETLSPLFKTGKWFLPNLGDLGRLYWYHSKGYNVDTQNAIFAKAVSDGVFTQLTSTYYWSALEYSALHAWIIDFGNGYVNNVNKCYSYRVRAVVAF
jgi:hypothetical protein